jgi:hypothetical protein
LPGHFDLGEQFAGQRLHVFERWRHAHQLGYADRAIIAVGVCPGQQPFTSEQEFLAHRTAAQPAGVYLRLEVLPVQAQQGDRIAAGVPCFYPPAGLPPCCVQPSQELHGSAT